jgi:hypothetical protein
MEVWYRELQNQRFLEGYPESKLYEELPLVDVKSLSFEKGKSKYEIVQIVEGKELFKEGAAQSHCVYSYAADCLSGECSIWSLRKIEDDEIKRLVTIELSADRKIEQARRKYNAMPTEEEKSFIRKWAIHAELVVSEF